MLPVRVWGILNVIQCETVTHFQEIYMPNHPPHAAGMSIRNRIQRTGLHPFGISVFACAIFFIYVFATRVPAGELRVTGSSMLATAFWGAIISMLLYSAAFVYGCRLLKKRSELFYLSGPVAMYGYLIWRMIAG